MWYRSLYLRKPIISCMAWRIYFYFFILTFKIPIEHCNKHDKPYCIPITMHTYINTILYQGILNFTFYEMVNYRNKKCLAEFECSISHLSQVLNESSWLIKFSDQVVSNVLCFYTIPDLFPIWICGWRHIWWLLIIRDLWDVVIPPG